MPTNVFISFERHNLQQVYDIRALASNPIHELEFYDRSELKPVLDKAGKPLPYQPDDPPRSAPIKRQLRGLLKLTTKMVVVISEFTHRSSWVEWEIQSFYDRHNAISGDGNRRILGMYVQNTHSDIVLPNILRTYSIPLAKWDMHALSTWINANPSHELPTLPYLFL